MHGATVKEVKNPPFPDIFLYGSFFILMKKSTLEFYSNILDTHCIRSTQNEKKSGNWTDYTMWHSLNNSMV
jgi:hypothetical protein